MLAEYMQLNKKTVERVKKERYPNALKHLDSETVMTVGHLTLENSGRSPQTQIFHE